MLSEYCFNSGIFQAKDEPSWAQEPSFSQGLNALVLATTPISMAASLDTFLTVRQADEMNAPSNGLCTYVNETVSFVVPLLYGSLSLVPTQSE